MTLVVISNLSALRAYVSGTTIFGNAFVKLVPYSITYEELTNFNKREKSYIKVCSSTITWLERCEHFLSLVHLIKELIINFLTPFLLAAQCRKLEIAISNKLYVKNVAIVSVYNVTMIFVWQLQVKSKFYTFSFLSALLQDLPRVI